MGRELAAGKSALGHVEANCCICRGTHLLGPMFFIDHRSGTLGGATAWLALGVWINCIAVRCDPTVNAIAAENIDQGVHVDHVVDFNAEFLGRVHGKVEDNNHCHRWRKGLLDKPQKKTLTRKTLVCPFFSNLGFYVFRSFARATHCSCFKRPCLAVRCG